MKTNTKTVPFPVSTIIIYAPLEISRTTIGCSRAEVEAATTKGNLRAASSRSQGYAGQTMIDRTFLPSSFFIFISRGDLRYLYVR